MTQVPTYNAKPLHDIFENLLTECEAGDFWKNFKKAAPIMFCMALEGDAPLKTARDMSFVEELLKSRQILQLMKEKIDSGAPDVDIVEYSLAVKTLENKIGVLNALNISSDAKDHKITLNV